jgi:hypothetical protein
MRADYASPFEILGCILAAEPARVCQQGADDVDGIRLKTGKTTEAEPFDGLCVRQGIRLQLRNQVTSRANPVDGFRDGSPPPSAASRAGCDSPR